MASPRLRPPRDRRPAPRLAALAATLGAIALGSLVVAGPASAHDQLISSDPPADATIAELPDELTLVYSGELIDADGGTVVEVTSPSGSDATDGDPVVDGTDVTVPLTAGEAGEYTVGWRVVSNDGHPVDGEFVFAVEEGEAPAAESPAPTSSPSQTESSEQTPEPTATADPAAGTPSDGDSFTRNLPWIIGGVVLIAGAGVLIAVAVSRRRKNTSQQEGEEPDDGDEDPPAR